MLIIAAREALTSGPWQLVYAQPSASLTSELAVCWPLRGADHLALAKTLQTELPEIRLLTFDARLGIAAQGEQLAVEPSGV